MRLLCVALNTRSVLLADKGVMQCDASFGVYSQLQRLFLALTFELPLMSRLVEDRVHSFVVSERNREKDVVASLGEFVPLLLVCKRYSWRQVRPLLVREVLARNVLWAGRHNVSLANNESTLSVEERLKGFWAATVVSNRLMMLSAMFIALSRRESLAEQSRVLDRLYGVQPAKTLAVMKRATVSILNANAFWPLYFKVLCGAPLPENKVEKLLKDAVRDSRSKGYHSKTTNFAAVHSSGTSKVLRKGESYTTGKDVSEVMLSLGWHFPGHVQFLDASLLCFNVSDAFLPGSEIDFNRPVNSLLGEACMHSGDQINGKQGEHNIRISLKLMPKVVHSVVLVLSAWTQDLSSITNPFVKLVRRKNFFFFCI
jgi:hypothetical protein